MKITSKLLTLGALLACAAHADAKIAGDLAAKVNDEPITVADYERARAALTEQYAAAMPDFFKQANAAAQIEKSALDKLVDEALLRQKAEAMKLKVYERELENGVSEIRKRFARTPDGAPLPPEEAEKAFRGELEKEGVTMEEFRERIRKQLMVQKLVQDAIKSRVKIPTEADVKTYFDNISLVMNGSGAQIKGLDAQAMQDLAAVAARFREAVSERLRLRHILIKTKEDATPGEKAAALKKAQDIRAELNSGLDFDEAVEKYSEDQESARRSGDLGYVIKGMLPAEIEETAFSLRVGGNSEPLPSKFGAHILRLEEKRAAQKLRYEAVKDDLEQVLSQNSFAAELTGYLKELRKNARIQTFTAEKKSAPEAVKAP
ncbi:MAG: hypothetical protein COT18_08435 [Elusimicrobia bacterium CG08_land_8_20_14_0_20_59_10]|nr:MAG: hypothetical protein COT18_08435 [Elusimicrobia bacterium CG08_land_8_20_14_0_20_59_10]